MTTFWIIAGAFVVVATLFVALPLLMNRAAVDGGGARAALNVSVYRDQLVELEQERRAGRLAEAQYDDARGELERRVLEDVPEASVPAAEPMRSASRVAAIAAALAVPLLAGYLYLTFGNPAALSPQAAADPNVIGPHNIKEVIAQLTSNLEKNPADGEGWAMLARTQSVQGNFAAASAAFAKSVAILPPDAGLLADYADALAMANGRSLKGEPEQLVARALVVDPDNVKALALAGTIAFNRKDFKTAVNHWERVVRAAPADSDFGRSIASGIKEAKSLAAAGGMPAEAGAPEPKAPRDAKRP